MTPQEIRRLLAAPYPEAELGWKPQSVKGNRALALPYLKTKVVMDRLDDILGIDGWCDSYEVLANESVVCHLSLKIDTVWITKTDVGSPSEQPDSGDQMKAAHSDALKRAAVKFGIGRYLYGLPQIWADYDPVKKQFVKKPKLNYAGTPDETTPAAAPVQPPPSSNGTAPLDGKSIKQRLMDGQKKYHGLYDFVLGCGKTRGWHHDVAKWKPDQLQQAIQFGKEHVRRTEASVGMLTEEQQTVIQEAINTAGPKRLELLAEVCLKCNVFSADDMTEEEAGRVMMELMQGTAGVQDEANAEYEA